MTRIGFRLVNTHKGMAISLVLGLVLIPSAFGFGISNHLTQTHAKMNLDSGALRCNIRERSHFKLDMKMKNSCDVSRRDILIATGTLIAGLSPILSTIQPAVAQIPGLDTRGERPAGLGPIADGRFLSLCTNENCVSTSEGPCFQ